MLEDAPEIISKRSYLHLEVIIVLPEFQRQGVATNLIQRFDNTFADALT